jgi:hypothetical protein
LIKIPKLFDVKNEESLVDAMFDELKTNFKYYLTQRSYGAYYFVEGVRYCIKNNMDYKRFIRKVISVDTDFLASIHREISRCNDWQIDPDIRSELINFLERFIILK